MNIKITKSTRQILENDNKLKEHIVLFLGEKCDTKEVLTIFSLIKKSLNKKEFNMAWSDLPFFWLAGFLGGLAFIYKRLWGAFFIAIVIFSLINLLPGVAKSLNHHIFAIIFSYLASLCFFIVLFSKLYYYFLIKKFINIINQNKVLNGKCSANLFGVVFVFFATLFIKLILFFN